MMSGKRWRLMAAGGTVIVGAATGVLINLLTAKWSIALAVGLGVLVVAGVLLQIALTAADNRDGPGAGEGGGPGRIGCRKVGSSSSGSAGKIPARVPDRRNTVPLPGPARSVGPSVASRPAPVRTASGGPRPAMKPGACGIGAPGMRRSPGDGLVRRFTLTAGIRNGV
jgi:hypothetical protein